MGLRTERSVLGVIEAGEKVERIETKKGAVINFLSQLPIILSPHIDVIYLHFNGALEMDSFGSLLEVHTFMYILWNNLYIWISNILLSDGRKVNEQSDT